MASDRKSQFRTTASLYDPDGCQWHDIHIVITPGKLRIEYPYGEHRDIVPVKRGSLFVRLRNWLGLSFRSHIYCHPDNFTVDSDAASLSIDIGLPMDEPILIRVQPDEIACVDDIKQMWIADSPV